MHVYIKDYMVANKQVKSLAGLLLGKTIKITLKMDWIFISASEIDKKKYSKANAKCEVFLMQPRF